MPTTVEYPALTGDTVKSSTLAPKGQGPAATTAEPASAPPKKIIGHGYFGTQPHAVTEAQPTQKPPAPSHPKAPAHSIASTVAMTKGAMVGFADELAKEAGLRDVLQRIFKGKGGAARKLGFLERRRAAKGLGVAAKDVEKTLEHRQRVGRAARGASVLGAAAIGGLAGSRLSKENADE